MARARELLASADTMRVIAILIVLMVASACGEDGRTSGGTSSAATGGNGGSGGNGGAAVGAGGNGGNGGSIEPLPPVPQACPSPIATPAATWTGTRFDALSLAWTGAVGALAYAESTGNLSWQVKLQRLDGSGAVIDNAATLGDVVLMGGGIGPLPRPVVSLTARGSNFVACWTGADDGNSIQCATIGEDGTVSAGLLTIGADPAVAMGPAGVGLVFIAGDELRSQLLAADATGIGSPHVVATSSVAPFPALPRLGASEVGYVANADVFLPRFDASFEEIDGAAASGWTSLPIALAGSGDIIGAVWGSLEGVQARVLGPQDEDFGAAVRIDGEVGNTSAWAAAVARAATSFAAAWSEDYVLRYAGFDLAAQPVGAPIDALPLAWRSESVAVTGVAGGFLAGAATEVAQDTIVLVHLACP